MRAVKLSSTLFDCSKNKEFIIVQTFKKLWVISRHVETYVPGCVAIPKLFFTLLVSKPVIIKPTDLNKNEGLKDLDKSVDETSLKFIVKVWIAYNN